MKMQFQIFAEVNGRDALVGTQLAKFAERAIYLFRKKHAMRNFNGIPFPALALTAKNCNQS